MRGQSRHQPPFRRTVWRSRIPAPIAVQNERSLMRDDDRIIALQSHSVRREDGGSGDGDDRNPGGPNVGVVTRTRTRTRKPSMYKVLMLNDDYTPMEFVVLVLEHFFSKSREEATRIMLHVHNYGVGVCGVYTYEVAETKVAQVLDMARRNEHPLQCTMERED